MSRAHLRGTRTVGTVYGRHFVDAAGRAPRFSRVLRRGLVPGDKIVLEDRRRRRERRAEASPPEAPATSWQPAARGAKGTEVERRAPCLKTLAAEPTIRPEPRAGKPREQLKKSRPYVRPPLHRARAPRNEFAERNNSHVSSSLSSSPSCSSLSSRRSCAGALCCPPMVQKLRELEAPISMTTIA